MKYHCNTMQCLKGIPNADAVTMEIIRPLRPKILGSTLIFTPISLGEHFGVE